MKTEVAIPHVEVPSHVRDRVNAKLAGLERFFEGIVSMRAVVDREHDDHKVELVAKVRRGAVLVVDSSAQSLSAALDDAVERMGRVLARHKDKLRKKAKARV